MAGMPVAERQAAMEALLAAEQRAGRYRGLLAEAEAEVAVLRRKLRSIIGREWGMPDAPRAADGAAGVADAPALGGGGAPPALPLPVVPMGAAAAAAGAEPGAAPAAAVGAVAAAGALDGDGRRPEGGGAAAAAIAGEPAGAGRAPKRKRWQQVQWPAEWVKVPYVRGGSKPADVCAGCWWVFQGYPHHRSHQPAFCLKQNAGAARGSESEPEGVDSD